MILCFSYAKSWKTFKNTCQHIIFYSFSLVFVVVFAVFSYIFVHCLYALCVLYVLFCRCRHSVDLTLQILPSGRAIRSPGIVCPDLLSFLLKNKCVFQWQSSAKTIKKHKETTIQKKHKENDDTNNTKNIFWRIRLSMLLFDDNRKTTNRSNEKHNENTKHKKNKKQWKSIKQWKIKP